MTEYSQKQDSFAYQSVVFFVFLGLFQLTSIYFLGIEEYELVVLLSFFFLFLPIVLNPFWGIVLLLVITVGIEGRIVEEFVLFRMFGANWYLIDVVFAAIFLGQLLLFINQKLILKFNWFLISFLIFFSGVLISIYWGLSNGYALSNVFHDFRGFFYYLIFIPTYFVLQKDKRYLTILFWVLIAVGTIKCTIDTYSSLFIFQNTYDSSSRVILNFARLHGYSEIIYPLVLVSTVTYFFVSNKILIKIILVPAIIVSSLALFLSYTRGSWVAAFATLFILFLLFLYKFRSKINYSQLGLFLIVIATVFFILEITELFTITNILNRMTSVSVSKIDVSNLGRLVEWSTALEYFDSNKLLGGGLGLHVTYIAPGIGYKSTIFIHNTFIYILSKSGLLTLIPYLIFLGSCLFTLKSLMKSDLETNFEKITLTFIMLLILVIIKSLTTWHLNMWTFTPFLGILLGVIYSYSIRDKN